MLGLKVQLSKLEEIIQALDQIPQVRFVAAATGAFDLFVEIIAPNNEDLYAIIKRDFSKIMGIESAKSSMILEIHKQSYDWGVT